MRIIAVNTGVKFGEWYVDNLKHMIDNYSGIKYDSFEWGLGSFGGQGVGVSREYRI